MKKLWQGIAIGVLGVAACQWLSLGDQFVHGPADGEAEHLAGFERLAGDGV